MINLFLKFQTIKMGSTRVNFKIELNKLLLCWTAKLTELIKNLNKKILYWMHVQSILVIIEMRISWILLDISNPLKKILQSMCNQENHKE